MAREHHLHDDAAQHYQQALNISAITSGDYSRISEKLAGAFTFGRNPSAVTPLYDRALTMYLDSPATRTKAGRILLDKATQLWRDSQTEAALDVISQAIHIAKTEGESHFLIHANLMMVEFLQDLSRCDDAEPFLLAAGDVENTGDPLQQALYYRSKGIANAKGGNASEAYRYFELAVQKAKETNEVRTLVGIWIAYAMEAEGLGNNQLTKTCFERALFVARRYHYIWRIPFLCLVYANTLSRMGRYHSAYEYLLTALSYDLDIPVMDETIAEVGIPLSLHMNDKETLARCARPQAIHLALQSGEPRRFGPVVTAFARLYASEGRENEARSLLHRAVNAASYVEPVWDLPIAVAQYGVPADIPKMRTFLEKKASIPSLEVARACLSLFDALVARRSRATRESYQHAKTAMERFNALGWLGYVDLTGSLFPDAAKIPVHTMDPAPLADIHMQLTVRERQVVELVLKGMTNREMAGTLSITERTIEAHMTSIMRHLGLRSRHQIVERLQQASAE